MGCPGDPVLENLECLGCSLEAGQAREKDRPRQAPWEPAGNGGIGVNVAIQNVCLQWWGGRSGGLRSARPAKEGQSSGPLVFWSDGSAFGEPLHLDCVEQETASGNGVDGFDLGGKRVGKILFETCQS